MGKKRPAPSTATAALPNGTAFRKSMSKKRKGDVEPKQSPSFGADKATTKNGHIKGKEKRVEEKHPKRSESVEMKTKAATMVTKPVNSPMKAKRKENIAKIEKIPNGKPENSAALDMKLRNVQSKAHNTFRVIVGSYERLLYGFQVVFKDGSLQSATFETIFSFAAHTSCITAVATAGADSKWLATGAGDETIRVWDLKKRKEMGGLIGHGGTIHSLSFPTRTYLLSTDSSGLINLYRTRDWALLKTLRGHTGKVNACVAHPSGKLALSVGKDGMLRMWDLMRGKGAGAIRLNLGHEEGIKVTFKEEPLDVKWNESGSHLAVMGRTEVIVFKTDMTRVASLLVKKDDFKRRFGCIEWEGDDTLLTGNEMGVVEVYRVKDASLEGPICKLVGHTNRVRSVRTIHVELQEKEIAVAATASSDGKIRLFDITAFIKEPVEETKAVEVESMASHNTGGARLTCLDVVGGTTGATSALDVNGHLDEDEDEDETGADLTKQREMGQAEMDELNDLLDLIEEAKSQGIHLEGMSEFESSEEESQEEGSDDDEDVYGDSDEEGIGSGDSDEVEGEVESEDEQEQEDE